MPEVNLNNSQQPIPTVATPKKPINWKLIGIIAVIVAIILGGLGYAAVVLDVFDTKEAVKKTSPTKTVTPSFDNVAAETDPFADPTGPFYQDIYSATSNDGLQFTTGTDPIIKKASIIDAIKLKDGTILIYAVDGAGRSKSGIMVAVSRDTGKTWAQGSVKITSKRTNAQTVTDPKIVLLPGENLMLFYIVSEGTKNTVYIATSPDGVNFDERRSVFSLEGIRDPDIVNINNTWMMYLSQNNKLILATSKDGLTFTYKQLVRENTSASNTVSISKGTWRQFYCSNEQIVSSTTKDGLNFQADAGSRLIESDASFICNPAPVQMKNGWLLFYKKAPKPAAPEISSTTHPDQNKWYGKDNVTLSWTKTGTLFSYVLDKSPTTIPDTNPEGAMTTVSFNKIGGGIWYFHVRAGGDTGWGPASHFRMKIDITPPTINVTVTPQPN
jgi:hypothetical protein